MIQIEHDQAQNGQPILRAVAPGGRKVLLHSRYDPERRPSNGATNSSVRIVTLLSCMDWDSATT